MKERGYAGERTGPVAVIPNPVDTDRFSPSDFSGSRSRLLVSLGRLSPMKGHRTLIRALAMLPGDVRAVIAGPPSQQTAGDLASFADELGVGQRLELAGKIDDPSRLISTGTAGIVTSLGSEVVSRAGMEMMSSGLPVLAAATNGLVDLVRDGVTGMLHSPGNHRQLAAQAQFLLDNPALAERMGKRARRLCLERYSYESVAAIWSGILEELVRGNTFRSGRYHEKAEGR
jgi:glycosyltransferase involved in cell wall biosynthesis